MAILGLYCWTCTREKKSSIHIIFLIMNPDGHGGRKNNAPGDDTSQMDDFVQNMGLTKY